MLSITRRGLGLAAAVAAFSPLAFAGSAQAASAASCSVSGTASVSPAVAIQGVNPPNGGGYDFSSGLGGLNLNCVVDGNNGVSVNLINVTSKGNYTNTVCGTGTATSTSNTINSITDEANSGASNDNQLESQNYGYKITFAAGQGVLQWTGSITGGGAISISPDWSASNLPLNGGSDTNYCTDEFTVNGSVSGAIS
ncbi:MAG: hypothetical protein JOZ15_07650 [Acidobacteria bacterium]|nr:hypothetical protein [Acidobacteriota bacterium]